MEIDHEKVRNCFDPRFDSRLGRCGYRSNVTHDTTNDPEPAGSVFYTSRSNDDAVDRFSVRDGRSN